MALVPAFIEISDIKAYSAVSENLDSKLLTPTLINVQELHLRQIIGKDLYAELVTQINAGTETALNITLLEDYIHPYLINKVIAESVIDLTYKLRNKAIMTTSSDFGQVANLTDLSKVQGHYNSIAEGYKTKLAEYLCENMADYPLYCPHTRQSSIGGIYLGSPRYETERYSNSNITNISTPKHRWSF
jgi:hypothetical protein